MSTEPHRLQPDPPEGSRETVDRELARTGEGVSPPGSGLDLESRIREALADEFRRQLEGGRGVASRDESDRSRIRIEGTLDLDAAAAVVAGTLAGGP